MPRPERHIGIGTECGKIVFRYFDHGARFHLVAVLPPRVAPQDEAPYGVSESFVLVAVGHGARLRLYLVAGIAHRDGETALAEHQHVVRHAAHGGDPHLRTGAVLRGAGAIQHIELIVGRLALPGLRARPHSTLRRQAWWRSVQPGFNINESGFKDE